MRVSTASNERIAALLRDAIVRLNCQLRQSRPLGELADRGLIQRLPRPTGGRQVILSRTRSGRSVLAVNRRAREAWLSDQIATPSAEERETLRRAAQIVHRISRA